MKQDGMEAQTLSKKYYLKLFVSGDDRNSIQARRSLERLSESRFKGLYELEIIDVLQDYEKALQHNVLVAPTLFIFSSDHKGTSNQPVTIVGSLNDISKVFNALGGSDREQIL